MTKTETMPAEFQRIADASMNVRDAASNLDAAKAELRAAVEAAIPSAKALDPDFQILGLGPALSAIEGVCSFVSALAAHYELDKVRRALRLPKPSTGATQRGPGGR